MFLFQLRLLKKCKFLIEKDHSEKELAVQVVYVFSSNLDEVTVYGGFLFSVPLLLHLRAYPKA
jgi:hypothetical protein